MAKNNRRDLVTYAFVSQGIFGSNDLFASLLPLIQPIVAQMAGQVFNAANLAQQIREKYPWEISADAVELFAPRMVKLGWVEQVLNEKSEAAFIYNEIPFVPYGENEEREIIRRLDKIENLFIEFLTEISPLEVSYYESLDLVDLLLKWLVEAGGFDRRSILAAAQGSATSDGAGEDTNKQQSGGDTGYRTQDDYLCGRFIQYLAENDRNAFEELVSISALTLIAEVVLSFREPDSTRVQQDVAVYYDGPFLMDLIGLAGRERQENASYIHKALEGMKVRPRVLDHSCDEVRDNLSALFALPPPERHGPTWSAICKAQVREQQAIDVLDNVESFVEGLKIGIVDAKTASIPGEEPYFPKDDLNELRDHINWERRKAAERDALSIAFVMRRRRGNRLTDALRSKAILLTRNQALAGIARRFCISKGYIKPNHAPPAIHQRELAGILFLILGSSERQEISRRDLLAACDDIVRCRPELVKEMRAHLAQIDTDRAENFDALILRPRSTQLLMDLTLGSNEILTMERATELYEKIRLSAAEEVAAQKDEEIRGIKKRNLSREKNLKEQISFRDDQLESSAISLEESRQRELSVVQGWMVAANKRLDRERKIERKALLILISAALVAALIVVLPGMDLLWAAGLTFLSVSIPTALLIAQLYGRFPRVLEGFLVSRRNDFFWSRVKEAGIDDLDAKYELKWDDGVVIPRRSKEGLLE